MPKVTLFLLLLSSFSYSQSYEQLMGYSSFYNRKIDSFIDHMKSPPAVSSSNDGIQQIVYEMDGFHIGIEEHASNNGIIGEMFIFQTAAKDAHSDWLKIHERISSDQSFKFIKGMYDDNYIKHNELALDHLRILLKNIDKKNNVRYAARYKKDLAYYTLSVIGGNMVLTIDSKNY
ncbi:hypothetical protein ACFOWU_07035 [Epilithonimonas zeae]|uniref:DUF4919 domain-containing protein n=1 Tax=Epilithonimonas zeae TaxID=1416779 RepID=A0A1N6FTX8_9FLAO|nr:hypothetical protein [Epilithonimonas zeae]SIN98724.1 hypothetical protein SAMN05444409_1476 [Epilithonimonas zeae]